MAKTIDIQANLSVEIGESIVDPNVYTASTYMWSRSESRQIEKPIQGTNAWLAPGFNMLYIEAIDKDYYGYIMKPIEAYVDPSRCTAKLYMKGIGWKNDNEMNVVFNGLPMEPIPALSVGIENIPQTMPAWRFQHQYMKEMKYYDFEEYTTFIYSYFNNVNVTSPNDPATVTIKSSHSSGTTPKTLRFNIIPHQLIPSEIIGVKNLPYDDPPATQDDVKIQLGAIKFIPQEITYSNNLSIGIAKCTIVGDRNFSGSVTNSYIISGDLSDSVIYSSNRSTHIEDTMFSYNGTDISAVVNASLRVKLKDKLWIDATEYTAQFNERSIVPGHHSGKLIGKNYCNKTSKDFSFYISAQISDCTVTPSKPTYVFNDHHDPIFPTLAQNQIYLNVPTVGKVNLIPNVNFSYDYSAYLDGITEPGQYQLKIDGINYWRGSKTIQIEVKEQ